MHSLTRRTVLLPVSAALLVLLGCRLADGSAPPATTAAETPAPPPAAGVIRGVVWHEVCEFQGGEAGEPVVLGRGCVQWGEGPGEFGPNQVRDPFETGFAGVTLHLGAGACPAAGLAVATTADDGSFRFDGVAAGTYCVSYSNTADGNDALLVPGGPTYPRRDESGMAETVIVESGGDAVVDFGYAWQGFN